MEWTRDGFVISTDPERLDRESIHRFLATSYWSPGSPDRSSTARSRTRCPSASTSGRGRQVGFARVITDRATFAYLADVFVLESHRGRGLALWLMETIRAHPELQNMRRWTLFTRDAHPLYRKVGLPGHRGPAALHGDRGPRHLRAHEGRRLLNAPSNWYESFFAGLAVEFWRAAVPEEATAADVAFLWKHLGLSAGSRVLDVPCGAGRLTLPLAARGCALTGVDISEQFLEAARAAAAERRLAVDWRQADMRALASTAISTPRSASATASGTSTTPATRPSSRRRAGASARRPLRDRLRPDGRVDPSAARAAAGGRHGGLPLRRGHALRPRFPAGSRTASRSRARAGPRPSSPRSGSTPLSEVVRLLADAGLETRGLLRLADRGAVRARLAPPAHRGERSASSAGERPSPSDQRLITAQAPSRTESPRLLASIAKYARMAEPTKFRAR